MKEKMIKKILKDLKTPLLMKIIFGGLVGISIILMNIYLPLGIAIFVGLMLMLFTSYYTRYVVEDDANKRINRIKKIAHNEIKKLFTSIFYEINLLCGYSETKNVKVSEPYIQIVLDGKKGKIFKRREKDVERLQNLYMFYLETDVINQLINVRQAYYRIDIAISTRNKQIERDFLRSESDVDLLNNIQTNLQIIKDGLQFFKDKKIMEDNLL